MPRRPQTITITIPLLTADYETFGTAVRILRRIMGDQAPDMILLVCSKLAKHDATGLAEDYLDLVGWPHARRRLILPASTPNLRWPARRAMPRRQSGKACRAVASTRNSRPADLSRN